jgi:hypothetical protein
VPSYASVSLTTRVMAAEDAYSSEATSSIRAMGAPSP